jgi:hypothetical protein
VKKDMEELRQLGAQTNHVSHARIQEAKRKARNAQIAAFKGASRQKLQRSKRKRRGWVLMSLV